MKGGAGVGLPSLNDGIWTWLAIVVIIWTSEIDFRKSQQRSYLFSKETNPKKKKKKKKKTIFQFQTCLSMSTFFSPSKQEEEDNDDDEEEDESVVRAKRSFWPSREVPTTRLSKSDLRDFMLRVFLFCDKVKSEENFETVLFFLGIFLNVFLYYYVRTTVRTFSQKL